MRLDVIVPVKNRETVNTIVRTLLREMAAISSVALGQLLLCDGGSTDAKCLQQIEAVSELRGVTVLSCEHAGFNKGWLLNQGLAMASADTVLISDVDILWRADALATIAGVAANHSQRIYSVEDVRESEQGTAAVRRQRYTYRIDSQQSGTLVEICADSAQDNERRPGCGIVCAQRQIFERIGGYKETFSGWGWEDQDFLIRAQLLGFEIATVGGVVHLSHGDEQRNASGEPVERSRDRNILCALESLKRGQLTGDWIQSPAPSDTPQTQLDYRNISIQYPPELGA